MNAESSEKHLKEIKRVLEEFVERYEILGKLERDRLKDCAKRELAHINAIINYVHSNENE